MIACRDTGMNAMLAKAINRQDDVARLLMAGKSADKFLICAESIHPYAIIASDVLL
jgi:hypothetical protein